MTNLRTQIRYIIRLCCLINFEGVKIINTVVSLIKGHTSIRKFKYKDLEKEKIDTIIQCAQMASTSSHFQAYTIIQVNDKKKRQVLFEASGEQKWLLTAPLVLLYCGDLHRGLKYYENINKDVLGNTESYTVATADASLAAQNSIIAAESMELGCVVVGGIRNDTERISKSFKLPDMVFPLYAICYGYPDETPELKPRLPKEAIHKIDYYDEAKDELLISAYNEEVSKYYIKRTDGKSKDRWTEHCGKLLMGKTRDEVGYFFRKIGLLKR